MFNELNKYMATVRKGIDTSEMEFKPLKEFCGKTIKVDGFFFTKGNYGTQVVVVGNGFLINMPSRAVEAFTEIYSDYEMLEAVLEGHLCIRNIKMVETKNGTTAAYKLDDC